MGSPQRVYDVLAFQGAKPLGEVLLEQILFNEDAAGMLCTGIQKLAQRFVLELLTEAGSMPYLPGRGTQFMIQFFQGQLRTESDVFMAFSTAVMDLELTLTSEDLPTDPPDECYASAVLDSVVITNGTIILHVILTSLAGTTREVIMPISTAPGMIAPIPTATPRAPLTTTVATPTITTAS
jgi:hypothetical protein